MCGIAGIIGSGDSIDVAQLGSELQQRLLHRGPDDRGLYVSSDQHVALAHTRLSILDLSPAGHQPMSTPDGRYTIVFNGEIYNFEHLRDQLQQGGIEFVGRSDTEVVLQLFRKYGSDCIRLLEGMFALAIWDDHRRVCFLARDPLGIKPLYYWIHASVLAFASELRALLNANLAPSAISRESVSQYFLFGSVQEPRTLIEGIHMLPAGHWMEWKNGKKSMNEYWRPNFPSRTHTSISKSNGVLGSGSANSLSRDQFGGAKVVNGSAIASSVAWNRATAARVAREALDKTIAKHLVSDVPIGVFLSGGVDSTAVVALMRRVGASQIRTFSITFDDPRFDEGSLARRTAKHFHTDHHEWRMTPDVGEQLVNAYMQAVDQPSIDGFNTFCVSKFAHDCGMKVVLSGLGGDELFGGYPSFRRVPALALAHRLAHSFGVSKAIGKFVEHNARDARIQRFGACLQCDSARTSSYWAFRGIFTPQEASKLASMYCDVANVGSDVPKLSWNENRALSAKDAVSEMELTRYMRNQLLRDSDVMSMAWGLELRVPFVDATLLDVLLTIPADLRLARGKRLLLDAVPEVPEWIVRQPKRGFAFPFEQWSANSWGRIFDDIDRRSPVRLGSWYRKWCVFALERFLDRSTMLNAQN